MWNRIKNWYLQYKEYVRVDLVMYVVLFLLILLYVVFMLVR